MSSAGVSRSGRVRKKSAKLIEMESESNNTPINASNNASNNKHLIKCSISPTIASNINNIINDDNSIDSNINNEINVSNKEVSLLTTDEDIGKPLKKKLKIKLPLNPSSSPAIASDVSKCSPINTEKSIKMNINVNNSECNVSPIVTKKATIPPLKIPKSKITGLLSPNDTNVDSMSAQLESTEENVLVSESLPSIETKPKLSSNKKSKTVVNKKETQDLKPEIKEEEKETIESIPEVENMSQRVEENVVEVKDEKAVIIPNNGITETPKVNKTFKPKKKEHESAANRLFRQITSGVAIPEPKSKTKANKKRKANPLPDLSSVSFDDDFEETSLVIATEDLNKPKPKKSRSRQTKTLNEIKKDSKKSKKAKNLAEGKKPKKKRSVITAYMLWSKEHRSKIQQTCPELDFADVSRKLGEIWHSMANNEKTRWRRKAAKLRGKGSSIISTGKPKTIHESKAKPSPYTLSSDLLTDEDYSRYTSLDEPRPIGTSPIDVSAHLRLLGESLSLIGQRLKEHSGQIAVSGSLSVLLDSTLCAIGPLLCLTKLDPNMDGCSQETHEKTLDNIAYIMPGI